MNLFLSGISWLDWIMNALFYKGLVAAMVLSYRAWRSGRRHFVWMGWGFALLFLDSLIRYYGMGFLPRLLSGQLNVAPVYVGVIAAGAAGLTSIIRVASLGCFLWGLFGGAQKVETSAPRSPRISGKKRR